MSKAEDLRELAGRIEDAYRPCKKLDQKIMLALKLEPDYSADWGPHQKPAAYPYTSSLDAAMTLVPEDAFWRVGHDGEGPDPSLFKAIVLAWFTSSKPFEAVGVTPALALTAAALRAQAQEAGE